MLGPSPRWHAKGLRIVEQAAQTPADLRGATLLLGNFDGFHLGHQTLLTAGRGASGTFRTPLGVMSCEPHPKSFFSRGEAAFRLTTAQSKEQEIGRYGFDFQYRPRFDAGFAGMSAEGFVSDVLAAGLGVSHVICGGDFRFGRGREGDAAQLMALGQALGITVTIMAQARYEGARISSSRIRQALQDGQLALAKSMLGRFWSFVSEASSAQLETPGALARLGAGRYHATWRPARGEGPEAAGLLHVEGTGLRLEGAAVQDGLIEITPLIKATEA